MTSKKDKSKIIILVSAILLIPNLGGLLVGYLFLGNMPTVFYMVCGIMIVLAISGLIYGLSMRKNEIEH